ncbi:spore-associated protein A [Nocardiopsis tropica]|uniref:Spore-associated protein A n=1 Tax=Nocardiopsis tropica TaxID=109330 RepID=A0ABV1ZXF6_9ACTN
MRLLRKSLTTAVATLTLLAGAASTATPASAAAYNGACGTGYQVVNSLRIPGNQGTVHLTYNNSNGYNCAVTIPENPGAAAVDVWLNRAGEPTPGLPDPYPGPVYVDGRGSCLEWGGSVNGRRVDWRDTSCG